MSTDPKEWVLLALLGKARGLRGELFADPVGTSPERFEPGLKVFLFAPGAGDGKPAIVERSWLFNGRLVLKFEDLDRRTEAEAIERHEVRIPGEERPPAPEGQVYLSDLVGFTVENKDGRILGRVSQWFDYGGPALLEVTGEKQVLVPFVPEICEVVDTERKRIVASLPEGLEELNQS